jgi:hypothetical protein
MCIETALGSPLAPIYIRRGRWFKTMIFSSLLTLCKVVGNVVKAKGLVISKHWKLVVAPRWGVHGKSWPNFMESYKNIV